ncbi:glycosyltransferase family 4 protein [Arthrobacter sp.]|uniref:glycosyltransferase family 4 protein n=1 Tax=Arthrobacter sp. TaxID=1667 RepID=UPI003A94A0FD
MRVLVVAESFLPHVNGVTHSVLQVLAHLRRSGHEALVIAPSGGTPEGARPGETAPAQKIPRDGVERVEGFEVVRLPSLPLTGYASVRVAAGTVARLRRLMSGFGPDVVHVASPFVLGWRAIQAAGQLGLPLVSIYQTQVPAYAGRYGVPWLEPVLWNHVRAMHQASTVTLVPSSHSLRELQEAGVPRLRMWRRGVDTRRFRPSLRDGALRARLAPAGERLVGYVGRLATEKQVEDLAVLADLPGIRVVIVGSGPLKEALRRKLPGAHFTGFLDGDELAVMMASLDLFVHPGESETFCQTIQEAMASGLPAIAVGRGGPLDLIDSSRTGWLYRPGDLSGLRERVADLAHDDAKRGAFAEAALASVQSRSWTSVCDELLVHYERAINVKTRSRHARMA